MSRVNDVLEGSLAIGSLSAQTRNASAGVLGSVSRWPRRVAISDIQAGIESKVDKEY
jgi:hypothetical protein